MSEQSGRFLYRGWDDEAVAYDTLTGDTHLIEALAAEVVVCLGYGEQTLHSLAQHLSDCFSLSAEEDILAVTESTLKRLESLGIAVAVSH